MFSRIRSFLSRHKRKLVVAGVVIGGAVILSRLAKKRLREWQGEQTKEFLERTQKQQHYETVERTCNQAALEFVPVIKEAIEKMYDTESLVAKLKQGGGNKIEIWEELKYLAFAKVTHYVYASSILMVDLRLQLNLIGGYMFKDKMDENLQETNDELNERFLNFTKFFLAEGSKKLRCIIEEKVRAVLKTRSLKDKLVIHDIEQIFWAIHSGIRSDLGDPCKNLPAYIIPADGIEVPTDQQSIYQRITAEIRDLLESEEIISLTSSSISRGFTSFVDKLADYFVVRDVNPSPAPSTSSDTFFASNIPEEQVIRHISIPMAKAIPIVNAVTGPAESKYDVSYTWMQQLIRMDDLKVLGANVYEGFSV